MCAQTQISLLLSFQNIKGLQYKPVILSYTVALSAGPKFAWADRKTHTMLLAKKHSLEYAFIMCQGHALSKIQTERGSPAFLQIEHTWPLELSSATWPFTLSVNKRGSFRISIRTFLVSKPEMSYPKTMKRRGLHSEKEPLSSVISNGGEESLEASEALFKESLKQLVPRWSWGQLVTLGCWPSFGWWMPCSATLPLSLMSTGSPWRWHTGWSLDILIHCMCINNINWCLKLLGVPLYMYMYMCRYSVHVDTCTCACI